MTTKVRWVAMGFDKRTERLVQEIELVGLRTDAVMNILGVNDEEEAIGASFDVNPERARALAPHAHGRLDLSAADWQLEARPRSHTRPFTLRCWQTPVGDVLVEQPVGDDLRKFYLLRAGCVRHSWERNQCSLDDSLYTLVYHVVEDRLECTMSEEVRCEERSRSRSTELAGLMRLPDMTAQQLHVAIARTRTSDEE